MPIKVRFNGLEIDGNLLPLFSLSLPYWELAREEWAPRLERARGLGFQLVHSPVPWALHELAEGDFDFGRRDPRRDLDAWLGLAQQLGLKVLLSPGPGLGGGELGLPERLLRRPELAAWGPEGQPLELPGGPAGALRPGGLAEAHFAAFDAWLSALAPLLQKHLHPHGPVVALEVGRRSGSGEAASAYAGDYSPEALKLWAHFLELKHRGLSALNKAWGSRHKSFAEAPAPRRAPSAEAAAGEQAAALDWVEFREYRLLWSQARQVELFRSRGLGAVPLYAGLAGERSPFNLAELESDAGLDFCGLDLEPDPARALDSVDRARGLLSAGRLAMVTELRAGGEAAALGVAAPTPELLLAPLMGGARGLNLAGDAGGAEAAALLGRFTAFLRQAEWSKAAPQNQGLLLFSRESQRLLAALDPGDPAAAAQAAFLGAAREFCATRHYSFSLADSGLAPERLQRHAFALAVLPPFLEEAAARRLRAYAEGGGLLVLGPCLPRRGLRQEALKAFEDLELQPGQPLSVGDGKLLLLESFDAKLVAAFLRKGKAFPEAELDDPGLELALHKCGGRLLLFVRNPHPEPRPAVVLRQGKFVLKPLWTSGKYLGGVEEREVQLAPLEIKVWEVIPVA